MALQEEDQIKQMRYYILNEVFFSPCRASAQVKPWSFFSFQAKDKAEEIGARALQEFAKAKAIEVAEKKAFVSAEFARKKKARETKEAIERSTSVNKQRLAKMTAQHAVLEKIAADSKARITSDLSDAGTNQQFVTDLIVQGLLMLLEENVEIRCRPADKSIVERAIPAAADKYKGIVSQHSETKGECNLTISDNGLSPDSLGGVVLTCKDGLISIDNTIDARLAHVMEQAKPEIRKKLFSK